MPRASSVRAKISSCALAALFVLLLHATAPPAAAASFELISRAEPVPDSFGNSYVLDLSADGRYVVFASDAPNLAPGQVDAATSETRGSWDLFLRDRVAGTTTLITHAAGSPQRAAGNSEQLVYARISADGRYVAFLSPAPGLILGLPGGGGFSNNAFLWDRVTGSTVLISHAAGRPDVQANGLSTDVAISADGGAVVFASTANDLVLGQAGPPAGSQLLNLFLYQRATGSVTLITHLGNSPPTSANGSSFLPRISADGGLVAFSSEATDLIQGVFDENKEPDVFLYDAAAGTLSLVSHAAGFPLLTANRGSRIGDFTPDGRWIAFSSRATNLIPGQIHGSSDPEDPDAFLYDRLSGETLLVSHTTASPRTGGGLGDSLGGTSLLAVSADGRYTAFTSSAPDLVVGQVSVDGRANLFLHDRIADRTALVTHAPGSATTTVHDAGLFIGGLTPLSLSADGRFLAFASYASDLVAGQVDGVQTQDVFLYDRDSGALSLASHADDSPVTAGNGPSTLSQLSADGRVVVFQSDADNLLGEGGDGQVDPNRFSDLFVYERSTGAVAPLAPRDPDVPLATPYGPSSAAGLSADGRIVLFLSKAAGLVPGQIDVPYRPDLNGQTASTDVFLRDRQTGETTLLSRSDASPATAVGGLHPVLSADGGFAAFLRLGNAPSLFLYDRAADSLTLINHQPGQPAQREGLVAYEPAISAGGRFVAYSCNFCSLVPHQQRGRPNEATPDVFLYDRATNTTVLVSHRANASAIPGNRESSHPRISADGRFVVFLSQAGNLVPGQPRLPVQENVFVFDRKGGALTLVSHAAGSRSQPADAPSDSAGISADGRWIFFRSAATDLVRSQSDSNETSDVFLYDQVTGRTVLVSHASGSPVTAGNAESAVPGPAKPENLQFPEAPISISNDGRWLVYPSGATDLAAGADANGGTDVFLYDRVTGRNTLVSRAAGSPAAADQPSTSPRISADGRRIAFLSPATDLLPGQTGAGRLVYLILQDRASGARTRIARVHPNAPVNDMGFLSFFPRLSGDGRQIAFTTDASGLVPGDLNATWDVYLFSFL